MHLKKGELKGYSFVELSMVKGFDTQLLFEHVLCTEIATTGFILELFIYHFNLGIMNLSLKLNPIL